MPHLHPLYDSDPHFSINADTRIITYTSPEKLILIQGDHNSEIVTFDIPRYIDGHDMMLCDVVQVHYINIDSNNSHNRNSGIYEVLDLQVSPDDENFCVCSWLISKNATLFVGPLTFTLRFACTNASKLVYVWNTAIYNGIPVSNGIDNSDIIVEEYADVLESWYWEFVSAGTTGVNVVVEAKDKAISEIEDFLGQYGGIIVSETEPESTQIVVWLNPTNSTLRIRNQETGEFEALTSIKGEKGDPGNVSNITQETGASETLVMSQKAVTDELNSIENSVSSLGTRVTTNEGNISDITSRVATNESRISDISNNYASKSQVLPFIVTVSANSYTDLQLSSGIMEISSMAGINSSLPTDLFFEIFNSPSIHSDSYVSAKIISTDLGQSCVFEGLTTGGDYRRDYIESQSVVKLHNSSNTDKSFIVITMPFYN